MSTIRVKPYQNKNDKSAAYGKWFMRVDLNTELDINDLSTHIWNDSKIERASVTSSNSAISKQIGELVCNGHPIRIPHLGILKLGVKSKGSATVSDYNAGTDVVNVHLVLIPDKEIKAELARIKFEKVYYQMKQVTEE